MFHSSHRYIHNWTFSIVYSSKKKNCIYLSPHAPTYSSSFGLRSIYYYTCIPINTHKIILNPMPIQYRIDIIQHKWKGILCEMWDGRLVFNTAAHCYSPRQIMLTEELSPVISLHSIQCSFHSFVSEPNLTFTLINRTHICISYWCERNKLFIVYNIHVAIRREKKYNMICSIHVTGMVNAEKIYK